MWIRRSGIVGSAGGCVAGWDGVYKADGSISIDGHPSVSCGIGALGFSLVCGRWFSVGWLGKRFIPDTHALALIGLSLTVAGCVFAIWARLKLGSNWSGRATVKMGHELVTSGPYALARHPIYTGIIVGVVGSALAYGEWRCVLGVVILILSRSWGRWGRKSN